MRNTIFVDVHSHVSFPQFDADRGDVIGRAKKAGVTVVNATVGAMEVPLAEELARKHENVRWTMGLSASETSAEKAEETIEAIRKHRKEIVGIGEVGLDYYWVKDEEARKKERENFTKFIELSNELGLPLVVHSRNAEEDTLRMLDEHKKLALLHCFSGPPKLAAEAAKKGHLISIPTNVVYVETRQTLAKKLPLASIVLESDAPYLPPRKGARNEPANVALACEKIARLRGQKTEEIAIATTKNAVEFYRLNK